MGDIEWGTLARALAGSSKTISLNLIRGGCLVHKRKKPEGTANPSGFSLMNHYDLIGLNSTIGVSSVYFSRKASCTVKECDAALLIASSYTSGDLPSIYYSNGVWKIKMEGAN
jgi:hypothetical protein